MMKLLKKFTIFPSTMFERLEFKNIPNLNCLGVALGTFHNFLLRFHGFFSAWIKLRLKLKAEAFKQNWNLLRDLMNYAIEKKTLRSLGGFEAINIIFLFLISPFTRINKTFLLLLFLISCWLRNDWNLFQMVFGVCFRKLFQIFSNDEHNVFDLKMRSLCFVNRIIVWNFFDWDKK